MAFSFANTDMGSAAASVQAGPNLEDIQTEVHLFPSSIEEALLTV